MKKAFDVNDLVEKLKGKGMDVAEEAAKVLVEETLSWIEESVQISESKYDDFALPVIGAVKPFVMKQIDLIDGKEG